MPSYRAISDLFKLLDNNVYRLINFSIQLQNWVFYFILNEVYDFPHENYRVKFFRVFGNHCDYSFSFPESIFIRDIQSS